MYMTMKKSYIEPKCRLIALSEEEELMSGSQLTGGEKGQVNEDVEGREVIRARSAWEDEW